MTPRAVEQVDVAYLALQPDPKNNRQTRGAAAVWAFKRASRWDVFEPAVGDELGTEFAAQF